MERKGIMQNSSSVFGGTCPGITNVGNNILARPPQLQAKEIDFFGGSFPAVTSSRSGVLNATSSIATRNISPHEKLSHHVTELVQCVIEGETRVLAASMIMKGFCKGAKEYKQEVFEKVQLDLNQFGLLIYDDNFKQLLEVPDCEYFPYLG
jgi:flotillin